MDLDSTGMFNGIYVWKFNKPNTFQFQLKKRTLLSNFSAWFGIFRREQRADGLLWMTPVVTKTTRYDFLYADMIIWLEKAEEEDEEKEEEEKVKE